MELKIQNNRKHWTLKKMSFKSKSNKEFIYIGFKKVQVLACTFSFWGFCLPDSA